ncbi:hypothetical protein [Faecalibacter bovis]|uniref:HEAT repeat domain-containing protein n=1 Tax=Faecalibacter bovis TaxID=2898187 RepID=A0ABX7XB00_9FLAO|nr:hypothetical protein [Faecalibacter bovis]QTV05067.1 hypothetical protein J9309_09725 [Faecalibacter bovis]
MSNLHIPSKYEIKYSLKSLSLNILWNLIAVILGIYLLTKTELDFKELEIRNFFILGISLYLIISFGKKIIGEILKIKSQIVISKDGIKIDKTNYSWHSIANIKIISKKEYTSKYKFEYEENYLTFKFNRKDFEIKIDNYEISKEKLNKIIQSFKNEKFSFNKQNVFLEIPDFETFLEFDEQDAEKSLKKLFKIAKQNKEELEKFCESEIYTETEKIEFVYYALSEKFSEWENFLISEFKRIFELAILDNSFEKLNPLLENILPEDCNSNSTQRIIQYLFNKLIEGNLVVKLQALDFLNYWIDENSIKNYPEIIRKLKELSEEDNWKIRWNSIKILKENKIEYKYNFFDDMRAKIQNPYEI